jgi:hypothetical protein
VIGVVRATVVYNNDFPGSMKLLLRQALEAQIKRVGAIVRGNNDSDLHCSGKRTNLGLLMYEKIADGEPIQA